MQGSNAQDTKTPGGLVAIWRYFVWFGEAAVLAGVVLTCYYRRTLSRNDGVNFHKVDEQ